MSDLFSKGGSGTQTVTEQTNNRPWYPQGQYLLPGFAQAGNLAGRADQQDYIGMTPTAQAGYQGMVNNANDPNSAQNVSSRMLTDTAGGNFLASGNPHFADMYRTSTQPMIDQFNEQIAPGIDASFSGAGRYGSGLYAQARNSADTTLTRGLGDVSSQLGFQVYDAERGRQMQAAAIAPQIAGQGNRDLITAGNAFQQDAQANQGWDWNTLQRYMQTVGGQSWGGSSTSTSSQPVNSDPLGQGLGYALTLASLFGGK